MKPVLHAAEGGMRNEMTANEPQGRYRFSCLLRAIFLLIGVPSLLVATLGFIGFFGLHLPGNLETTGTIVAIKNGTGECPTYEVAFTAKDGSYRTFEWEWCPDQEARIGQTVSVLYDPQNPDLYPTIIERSRSGWYRLAAYGIVGLVFTLLGLLPLRIKLDRLLSWASRGHKSPR